MRRRVRITEDELRERIAERHSERNVADLELTICRQAMRIQRLERQVADLSERETARMLRAVVSLLGLKYANDPRYLHTTFTAETRRELAEMLRPVINAEQEGSDD